MDDVLLLVAAATLSASQVLQKLGADRRLRGARTAHQWLAGLLSRELLGALFLLIAGTLLWLLVLYRMDVSRAFPFLSLGYVLVIAISRFWLHEHVPRRRWVGVVLIAAGIAMIAGT